MIVRMRLLYLTLADVDDRSYGGALRSHHIREAMRQVGEVDTLVIHGDACARLDAAWNAQRVKRATYDRLDASVGAWRQRLLIRRWVAAVVRDGSYDVIVARYLGLAVFVPFAAWPRLVVDADDIFKSIATHVRVPLRWRAARWARNQVARTVLARAGHVWFVNPADAPRLRTRRLSWLPNVVQMPDSTRARPIPVQGRILMVGYFHHPPNAQALLWFAEHVLPAVAKAFPGVELQVIGKCPAILEARLGCRGIRFSGFVDALTDAYDRAALVIAPIQSGGGTQIKVIDALAHGRPLVVSRFAHAGFADDLRDGLHLRVADGAADWIAQCAAVLRNPGAAEAMGARGQDAVGRYGAHRMIETVRETLLGVAARTPAAPRAASV
jgi:glycosyltransferase involved in cell wall biosynthesis